MSYITIQINNFSFYSKTIFINTEISFAKNGIYYIEGENGSGKSTFLNIFSGNLKDKNINYFLNDKKITYSKYDKFKNNNIFYCLQDDIIFDNKTVLENLFMPFLDTDKDKASKILEILELKELSNSNASTLSNGEKARLSFARALYSEKTILILDEITSSLDNYSKNIIENIILKLASTHLIIFTSNEQVGEKLLNNSNILQIKDKKINKITDIETPENKKNCEVNKKSKINFRHIFSKNSKFYALFGSCFTFFTTLMLIFSSLTNATNVEYKENLLVNEYLKITPSIILDQKTNLDKFPQEDLFDVQKASHELYFLNKTEKDFKIDYLISPFNENSFVKHLKLQPFKSGLESSFPQNENQILISSLRYEKIIKQLMNEFSSIKEIDNYIVSTESNTIFGEKVKIIGVYEAINNEKLNSIIDSYKANKGYIFTNSYVDSSYSFKMDSVFYLNNSSNKSDILLVNNENNRKLITRQDVNNNIKGSANFTELFGDILAQNTKNENVLGKYLYGVKGYEIFVITVGCVVIFLFILNFYNYYILNVRRLIFLRATNNSRASLIKSESIKLLLFNIITLGISILLTLLFTFIYSSIVNSEFMFINIPNIVTLGSIALVFIIPIFIVISVVLSLFFTFKILIPKNFRKAFYRLNKK